jgi:hypothetical protein
VSIDDQHNLYERLDRAVGVITPREAPVERAMRRGRGMRLRRRSAVAGVAAVVAAAALAVPALRQAATHTPAAGRYTVTVQAPGPHAPAGLIASGTVNSKSWQLVATRPGTDGIPRGQEQIRVSGAAVGRTGLAAQVPALGPDGTAPVSFTWIFAKPTQVQFGAVQADVSYVTVRLGNGTVLTLHPARVFGARVVAFAAPMGATVVSATAHSRQGDIATAIPFNGPGGMASFGTWLRPGQPGLARASGRIGSGSYLGGAWSAEAYMGPWGVCLEAAGGGTNVGSCVDATSVSGLGTTVMFWAGGVPGVAGGSADASVVRIAVTSPDGKTVQVHPVTVGGAKFFAFPISKGVRPWNWTAYDGSGRVVAVGTGTPDS